MRKKTEYRRKQEGKAKAARELEATKKRLGLGEPGPLRGATPSPLEATSHPRTPNALVRTFVFDAGRRGATA